ncbi:MAG TPA: hypothetical protein PLJ84_10880 [Bacteroidales bacterium]|nr:hypothetical protein [Bacteroidales bacterium]
MKKTFFIFTSLLLSGVLFLSSCTKDSSDPEPQYPTIQFVGGAGYTSTNVTVTAGSPLKFGINAFSNTSTNTKLVKFTITRVFNNVPSVVLDSTINTNTYSVTLNTSASTATGSENIIFKITDKDNNSASVNVVITTTPGAGPINTWTQKIIGAQANITGSSFASINGNVYSLADAKNNSAKIDWVYFYGATNLSTLACPADPDAQSVYNNTTNGIQTWTTKNLTLFKKVTSNIVWSDITDDSVIVTETASGVDKTKMSQLATGDILSFIAATGKKGLIKVDAITTGNDGMITISVKVQQ